MHDFAPEYVPVGSIQTQHLPLDGHIGRLREQRDSHALRRLHAIGQILGTKVFFGHGRGDENTIPDNDRLRPARSGNRHLPCQIFRIRPCFRNRLIGGDSQTIGTTERSKVVAVSHECHDNTLHNDRIFISSTPVPDSSLHSRREWQHGECIGNEFSQKSHVDRRLAFQCFQYSDIVSIKRCVIGFRNRKNFKTFIFLTAMHFASTHNHSELTIFNPKSDVDGNSSSCHNSLRTHLKYVVFNPSIKTMTPAGSMANGPMALPLHLK